MTALAGVCDNGDVPCGYAEAEVAGSATRDSQLAVTWVYADGTKSTVPSLVQLSDVLDTDGIPCDRMYSMSSPTMFD